MQAVQNARHNFVHYIGQGGVFDIQRDPKNHIFYKQMIAGSNDIVGVFSRAATLNKFETFCVGMGYGLSKSSNRLDVYFADRSYWYQGIDDVNSGKAK